jgi:4'-phosphopantetheinyl transferase
MEAGVIPGFQILPITEYRLGHMKQGCKKVQVYYTPIEKPLSSTFFLELLQMLPADQRERNCRYRRWQDRHAHLYTRLQLIEGFKYFGSEQNILSEIQYGVHNRPFIPGNIDFNVSHSDGYAICAIGKEMRIGVDIELCREIDLTDYASTMNQIQWNDIYCAHDPTFSFFSYWVRKEAIIKADGRGLFIPIDNIYFENKEGVVGSNRWFMYELKIDPKQQSWLACNMSDIETELIEYLPVVPFHPSG